MLSILINAYACSPNMGSEPGMAWNWCVKLAQHCELHIITEGEFSNNIEAALPALAQAKNMHFYYNPVSEKVRKMCWNQGDWRFYYYYRRWQKKTLEIARQIISNNHIDIVHQLNMIGFREPGELWRIKEIPFVWGPVDAKQTFPTAFLEGASFKTKVFVRIKNLLTYTQLAHSKLVRNAAHSAAIVVSASSESKMSFKRFFEIDSPLLNETGCYEQKCFFASQKNTESLDLLWVGKFDFRKQLSLAIHTIAATKNRRIKLHIVGGLDEKYKLLTNELGINEQCVWHGSISHSEVQEIMQQSDLFFFTSVAEGTPHVVLEAIGNKLPVLCFDVCGHGDSVNESVGIKIPLTTPKQSIQDFATVLNDLERNREKLRQMSANCTKRAAELSWHNKALQMVELYHEAIEKHLKKPSKSKN